MRGSLPSSAVTAMNCSISWRTHAARATSRRAAIGTARTRSLRTLPLELLQVKLGKLRLWIERVDVRRPAFHHQEDAVFRFLGGLKRWCKKRCKCKAADARAESVHELAPRTHMDGLPRRSRMAKAGAWKLSRHTQTRSRSAAPDRARRGRVSRAARQTRGDRGRSRKPLRAAQRT